MALHRLGIRDEKLFLDDALVGLMMMNPPEGISAAMETEWDDGIMRLKVRWLVESSPEHLLPLELLRLRLVEFYPKAAFIGGRRYDISQPQPVPKGKLGFPLDRLGKFTAYKKV